MNENEMRDEKGKFIQGHKPTGNYFKKGHIGYNKGKRLVEYITRECKCGNIFESLKSSNKFFHSRECSYRYRKSWGNHTQEAKEKISKSNHKFYSEHPEKIPTWNGGTSYIPYGKYFRPLRKSIRRRDNRVCMLCGIKENGEELAVHHIDYSKTNYNGSNLISLCRSCHAKTNANRNYWVIYFRDKMEELYGFKY